MSVELAASRDRTRHAVHLLWAVPVAAALSMIPISVAAFTLCGIGCYSPAFVHDENVPFAGMLCIVGGLIVFLAVQLVPWSRRGRSRLLVSIPAAVLWAGLWLLHGMQAFDPLSPVFAE